MSADEPASWESGTNPSHNHLKRKKHSEKSVCFHLFYTPPKQTWNLKMGAPWKRRFLLETIISRFHFNFWGRRWWFHWSLEFCDNPRVPLGKCSKEYFQTGLYNHQLIQLGGGFKYFLFLPLYTWGRFPCWLRLILICVFNVLKPPTRN